MKKNKVLIGTDGRSFVAATVETPYFCFEGPSEGKVLKQAERALQFYHGHELKILVERVRFEKWRFTSTGNLCQI